VTNVSTKNGFIPSQLSYKYKFCCSLYKDVVRNLNINWSKIRYIKRIYKHRHLRFLLKIEDLMLF